ncbi:unnamed protein product [Ixodes pacificus]
MEERRECATDRNAPDRVRNLPQSHPREGKALCRRRVSDVRKTSGAHVRGRSRADIRGTSSRDVCETSRANVFATSGRSVRRTARPFVGNRARVRAASRPFCACGRNLGALRVGRGRVRLRARWIWGRVQRRTTCDLQSVAGKALCVCVLCF